MTSEYTTTECLLYANIEMLSIQEKLVDRMFTNPDRQNTFKGFVVNDFH